MLLQFFAAKIMMVQNDLYSVLPTVFKNRFVRTSFTKNQMITKRFFLNVKNHNTEKKHIYVLDL